LAASPSEVLGAVLSRFVAVVVVAGLVAVRVAVVEVVGRVVVVVDFDVVGLVEESVEVREPVVDATLDRRSRVEVVDFAGALVLGVLPASDMRLADPVIPRFSSPELATERDFSSAELSDGRERCDDVVDVLRGLRTVPDVVVGRVGGLPRVLPFEPGVRVVVEAVLGPEIELGLFVAEVPETGRFVAEVADVVVFFAGDALTFSLSLEVSGLVTGSSLPETALDSTGVAGGISSASASTSASTSAAGAGATGSSTDDIACIADI